MEKVIRIRNRKTILPRRAGIPPENIRKNSRALIARQHGQCKIKINKRIRSGYLIINEPDLEKLEAAGIKRLLHDGEHYKPKPEKYIVLHELGCPLS